MDPRYVDAARLLMQVAPTVFASGTFALKGGTAINLFEQDMPRLSIDLDLVLRDGTLPRADALARIASTLRTAAVALRRERLRVEVPASAVGVESRLSIAGERASIQVEVNLVLRGTVRPVREARLVPAARAALLADTTLPVLSRDEIYGGKLVAALDRQHPRDLFDVDILLGTSGIDDAIVECFVAYLACHNRPIDEVLFAPPKDIAATYRDHFTGMTTEEVPLDRLLEARARILHELPRRLTAGQRTFLRTLARAEPDYAALGLPGFEHLPGIRWKFENLRKLRETTPRKLEAQADALDRKLGELD